MIGAMIGPALLGLGLLVGLLVLLPARRLQSAGFTPRLIGTYALVVWLGALLVAARPGPAGFLVPIVLVAYLAPFVTAPDRMGRVLRRGGRDRESGTPPREVTPDDDEPNGE